MLATVVAAGVVDVCVDDVDCATERLKQMQNDAASRESEMRVFEAIVEDGLEEREGDAEINRKRWVRGCQGALGANKLDPMDRMELKRRMDF